MARKMYRIYRGRNQNPVVVAGALSSAPTPRAAVKVSPAVRHYVKSRLLRKGEMKSFDTAVSINPATAGAIVKLSTIAQGDDINNRDGDQISARSQTIHFSLETTTASTGNPTPNNLSVVRIIIFQDRYGDSTPTVSGTTNTSLLAAASITANYNLDTMDRYKILYDRKHTLSQRPFIDTAQLNAVYPVGNQSINNLQFIRRTFKLNKKMEFADTTGTLPAKNQTYILTIVHALGTSQVITISGYTRLKFKDE